MIYKDLPVDDPMQRKPDITLAKKLLDWIPLVSRKDGMLRTFNYFETLSNEELYKSEHKSFDNHIRK